MNTLYTAKVQVIGGRDGSIRSDDGHLAARLAFPTAMGGDGRGTNPEQLFAAGYAACFASSLQHVARGEGLALGGVEIAAEVDMLHEAGTFDLAVRLRVKAAGDRAVLRALIERTEAVCPYARATRRSLATSIELED